MSAEGGASGFRDHQIAATDGYVLAARVFLAVGPVRGTVLIAAAMGVVQGYYATLASWLAGQGFNVLSFDYRGMGQSRRGPLRGFRADILDWARLDCAAMLDAAMAIAPGQPVYWIGHSLGGQILPFVPGHARLSRAITVACGSGYWRENAPSLKRYVWFLWYVLAPLLLRLFGYFPGRRLGMIGDLPHGVMAQWRRWCLHPDYAVGVEGERARAAYDAVTTPLTALSFSDDEYMSARSIESLHDFYRNAPQDRRHLTPAHLGLQRIGHFGFFRAEMASAVWTTQLLPSLRPA